MFVIAIKYYLQQMVEILFFFKERRLAYKISSHLQEKSTKQGIDKYQERKLAWICASAIKAGGYYSKLPVEATIKSFPIVGKKKIRVLESQFINYQFSKKKKFKFTTGGSTGEPFSFFVSRMSGLKDRYHFLFFFKKIGYLSGDKIFSLDGVLVPEKDIKRNIYWKRTRYKDIPYGSLHFSTLCLTKETASYYIEKLNQENPAFIRSYPSAIVDLANYIKLNNIKIGFKLKGIVLSSENVYQEQIQLLNETFNTPVYGQYGHSEMSVFAYTEANSLQYKCSPYYSYVEILNKEGEHAQEGESGNIVVTDFFNHAMFFIRYDTGDVAGFGGYDENGFLIFDRILGREQEFIYNKRGETINVTALIFGQHYKAFSFIEKWQIEQIEKGKCVIHIIKSPGYSTENETEIRMKFNDFNIDVDFNYPNIIPLTQRGKHQLVKLNIR